MYRRYVWNITQRMSLFPTHIHLMWPLWRKCGCLENTKITWDSQERLHRPAAVTREMWQQAADGSRSAPSHCNSVADKHSELLRGQLHYTAAEVWTTVYPLVRLLHTLPIRMHKLAPVVSMLSKENSLTFVDQWIYIYDVYMKYKYVYRLEAVMLSSLVKPYWKSWFDPLFAQVCTISDYM